MSNQENMRNRNEDIFAANRVITEENFTLFRSGGKGADYVDIDTILSDVSGRKNFLDNITDVIKNDIQLNQHDIIAFLDKADGPVGLLPYATAIADEINIPVIIVRLNPRIRHKSVKIKGIRPEIGLEGKSVLLLDDVVTTGSTQKNAIDLIEQRDANVQSLLSVYSRDSHTLSDIKKKKNLSYSETMLTFEDCLELGLVLSDDPDDYNFDGFVDRIKKLYDLTDQEAAVFERELEEDSKQVLRETIETVIEDNNLLGEEEDIEEAVESVLTDIDEEFKQEFMQYLHRARKGAEQSKKKPADD